MRKHKRIILVGKGASGKDYLAGRFFERGYRKDISFTTREMRDREIPGKTYNYISRDEFERLADQNYFFEKVEFDGNYYGTSMDDWNNASVFIMTPSGVSQISEEDRKECIVVYLDISESVRMKRFMKRSDAHKTERRLKADAKDFKGFIDYDYRITSPKFNADEWINLLIKARSL